MFPSSSAASKKTVLLMSIGSLLYDSFSAPSVGLLMVKKLSYENNNFAASVLLLQAATISGLFCLASLAFLST